MPTENPSTTFFFFFFFFFLLYSFLLLAILPTPAIGAEVTLNLNPSSPYLQSKVWKIEGSLRWKEKNARRLMIGSIAPTCTYNECRGCRFKCRAEQVPVDANDPVNSAYRYRCVCHR